MPPISTNYTTLIPFDPPLTEQTEKDLVVRTLGRLLHTQSCEWNDDNDEDAPVNSGSVTAAWERITVHKDVNTDIAELDLSRFNGTVIHCGLKDPVDTPFDPTSKSVGTGLAIYFTHKGRGHRKTIHYRTGVGARLSMQDLETRQGSMTLSAWRNPAAKEWDRDVKSTPSATATIHTVEVGDHAIRSFRNKGGEQSG